jgi:hypothetical protein
MGLAHVLGDLLVVVHQLAQHHSRRHEIGIVVLDGLELGDMADRTERGAADLADPLGHVVGRPQDVGGLLVQQQVIVTEMRPADVPVEILGLEIKRVARGQEPVECFRHRLDGRGIEIGRRIERGGRLMGRFQLGHLAVAHGITSNFECVGRGQIRECATLRS